jgi:hypothetical protein
MPWVVSAGLTKTMNALGAISASRIKRLDAVVVEGDTVIIRFTTAERGRAEIRLPVEEARQLLDRLSCVTQVHDVATLQ